MVLAVNVYQCVINHLACLLNGVYVPRERRRVNGFDRTVVVSSVGATVNTVTSHRVKPVRMWVDLVS